MIRLSSIQLENFKNTQAGSIRFPAGDLTATDVGSSVVGLYGQNGSGKTSVVEALSIVRRLLGGQSLIPNTSEYIGAGHEFLGIGLDFCLEDIDADDAIMAGDEPDKTLRAWQVAYSVSLARKPGGGVYVAHEKVAARALIPRKAAPQRIRTLIECGTEAVALPHNGGEAPMSGGTRYPEPEPGFTGMAGALQEGYRASLLDDARTPPASGKPPHFSELGPKAPWRSLVATSGHEGRIELELARRLAYERSQSLIFSTDMLGFLRNVLGSDAFGKSARSAVNELAVPLITIVYRTREFALADMAIVSQARQAAVSINLLPLSTYETGSGAGANSMLPIAIDKPAVLSQQKYEEVSRVLGDIDIALAKLVPGLRLTAKSLGRQLGEDGGVQHLVEIVSLRDGVEVPLRHESEGIKKIISILALLVDVYWNPGACVVVDEFDSGVFEYLLGQIVEVLAEHGRGQLIFTAHNLHPLEVLPRESVVFTTINPANRYLQFSSGHAGTNLRDMYLRAIRLGGQSEPVSNEESKYTIDAALFDTSSAVVKARRRRLRQIAESGSDTGARMAGGEAFASPETRGAALGGGVCALGDDTDGGGAEAPDPSSASTAEDDAL